MGEEMVFDGDAGLSAIEYCFEEGWSDGLPVVPPTEERVAEFLASTDRDKDEVVARIDHLARDCTVELAAINSVMAGCLPEYFPVVLAGLEAAMDEGSPKGAAWQSTSGGATFLVVNGPARDRHGFNSKGAVFGPGFRPNATIGRAMRLIVMNAFGIRPHALDQATQGTPARYTLCIAENEEESPWEPLHVELGFDRSQSVVSALHIRSCDFVDNKQSRYPEHILNDIVDTISRTGVMNVRGNSACIVFGPEHAQILAEGGYSKRDVKEYVATHAGRSFEDLERVGKDGVEHPRRFTRPATEDERGLRKPGDVVRIVASESDVLIVVAGAGNAGASTVIQPFAASSRKVPGRALVRN